MSRYLGIDYGHRKIGLAISDEQGNLAYPYKVLPTDKNSLTKIAALCRQENITLVVVGDTKDLKGQDNLVTLGAKQFVSDLSQTISLPLVWQTEVFSSREAERIVGDDSLRDARAAAIILQSYLDSHRL